MGKQQRREIRDDADQAEQPVELAEEQVAGTLAAENASLRIAVDQLRARILELEQSATASAPAPVPLPPGIRGGIHTEHHGTRGGRVSRWTDGAAADVARDRHGKLARAVILERTSPAPGSTDAAELEQLRAELGELTEAERTFVRSL